MMKKNKTLLPRQLGDAHIRLLRIYKVVIESGGFAAAEVDSLEQFVFLEGYLFFY